MKKKLKEKFSICRVFSRFRTIFLHHKWNGIRLLSPESEYTVGWQVAERLNIRILEN